MEGTRLVSAPPPRPAAPPPHNFRPLVYLVFILFLVGVAWFYKDRLVSAYNSVINRLTNHQSTVTPAPAPEWMTYTNDDFSFEYPGSWTVRPKTLTGCGFVQSIVDREEKYEITVASRCNYNNATGQKYKSLEDYLHESPAKITYTTIDSVRVARITSYLATSKDATEAVFISPSDNIYAIDLGAFTFAQYPSPLPDNILPVFTRILSTLKFTQ